MIDDATRTRVRWLAVTAGLTLLTAMAACSGSDGGNTSSGNGGGAPGGGTADGGGSATGGGGGTSTGGGMTDPCDAVMCADGEVCDNGNCVEGCSDTDPCAAGGTCCDGACIDVGSDVNHCGMCDDACNLPENQDVSCQMGICTVGGCTMGFFDCDGLAGCEASEACSCMPGESQPCYPGPAGTDGTGICLAGTRQCNAAGTAWGLCEGFILPEPELCNNNIDEDCSGVADDVPDIDGDGWTACDNDCCETAQDCGSPGSVNPGAFEFVGNMLDDDCDPATSDVNPAAACSTSQDFTSISPQQMAQAMDICQFTSANEPLPTRKWGIIDASFRRANGTTPSGGELNEMMGQQTAILVNYGTGGVVPQLGPTMAGISSGRMRDQNDPSYVNPNGGTNFGNSSQPPAAYLAANGGQLPASQSCNGNCPAGSGANDSVNLRLEIRVPTNAQSFAYQFRFFSSEYWTYSCTTFNDFYLTQYTSNALGLPADKNISFDSLTNPVSVNNGFFEVCVPKGCYTCPNGSGALSGTGMQLGNTGGGTVWLQTTAPVVPGETMVLEMMVFDVSDNILDSLALLDAFTWSINPSTVGTGPPG
jgi:hypothetical protein